MGIIETFINWLASNPLQAMAGLIGGSGGTTGAGWLIKLFFQVRRVSRKDKREAARLEAANQKDIETQQHAWKVATGDRITMLEGTIDLLQETVDFLKKQSDEAREAWEYHRSERDRMQLELDRMRGELRAFKAREDKNIDVIAALEDEVTRLEGEVKRLDEANKDKAVTIETLQKEIDTLHKRIAELTQVQS